MAISLDQSSLMFIRKNMLGGKQFNGKDNRAGDGLIPRKIGNAMGLVDSRWDVVPLWWKYQNTPDKRITEETAQLMDYVTTVMFFNGFE